MSLHAESFPTRACLLALAALAAGQPAAIYAQQSPTPAKPAATSELAPVVVTGSADRDDRRESTAAKIVVGRDDIARFGDANVADILNRVPGVTVSGTPGRGGEVRMRGLGNGYTQILLNGEPTAPGFSIDSLAPGQIERIEVMRTATADQSAQAIAGTINIILKQVVRQGQRDLKIALAEERQQPALFVDGQFSDRQGPLSYTLAGSVRQEKYATRSSTQRSNNDAFGQTQQAVVDHIERHVDIDTFNLTPRVNWTIDSTDSLAWDALLLSQRVAIGSVDEWSATLGAPPAFSSNQQLIPRYNDSLRNRFTWTRNLADAAKLEVKFGVSNGRRLQPVVSDYFDPGGALLLGRRVDSLAKDDAVTLAGKYRTPFLETHALVLGWDGEDSRRWENRIQNEVAPTGLATDNSYEVFAARVRRLAFFAQDEWDLTPRWSTYLGLRWEGMETRSIGNDLSVTSNRSSVLSPIVQNLWKVPDTGGDQVRLGLARTYKAPTTSELMPRRGISVDNSITSPDTQGNPLLRPELAWGFDLAYERHLEQGSLLSANLFARNIRDVMQQEVFADKGRWIAHPINNGNAQARGIELEAKGNLRKLLPTAPALDIRANLARNWSTLGAVPGPNNRLSQQAPLTANLGADWRPDGWPLTLGGNFAYLGGGQLRLSSNEYASLAPRRTLDVYGLWKIDSKTQLRLSLANLLHQDMVQWRSYANAAGSVAQTTTYETAPVMRLTLELKL